MRRLFVLLFFWSAVPLLAQPALLVPNSFLVPPNSPISVPVFLDVNGFDLAGVGFSLDFDESCLTFDPTDGDLDGIPDAITFQASSEFTVYAAYDASDLDGELDLSVVDVALPTALLPNSRIATITFTTCASPGFAPILFSGDPPASFTDPFANDVPGVSTDGGVVIWIFADGFETGDASQWSSAIP